jgi:FtsP/CotA-like multicopper oxidase with cupredoxin domain
LTEENRGTFWIHSHFGFQVGSGMAAPLIIKGNNPNYTLFEDLEHSVDVVMLLQDLCPYTDPNNITCDPNVVLQTLREDFISEDEGEVESCPGIEPAVRLINGQF